MTNEKGFGITEEELLEKDTTPRARNRTVMLSPEMTGAVRARIAQGLVSSQGGSEPWGGRDSIGSAASRSGDAVVPVQIPLSDQSVSDAVNYDPSRSAPLSSPPTFAVSSAPTSRGGFQQPYVNVNSGSYTRYQKVTPIVGFLISYDLNPDGEVFDIRTGRIILTSDDSSPGNLIHIADESVSPSHAVLRMTSEGELQILDQLSEFGTKVSRCGSGEVLQLSGDKSALYHGDVLQVGNRSFHVCLVVRSDVVTSA
jgi:hypothetical protein